MYGQKLHCQACDSPMTFNAPKTIETTKFHCPSCNQKYSINESQYGTAIACTICETTMHIPHPKGTQTSSPAVSTPKPSVRGTSVNYTSAVDEFYANRKKSALPTIAAGIVAAAIIGGGYYAFTRTTGEDVPTPVIVETPDEKPTTTTTTTTTPTPVETTQNQPQPSNPSNHSSNSIASKDPEPQTDATEPNLGEVDTVELTPAIATVNTPVVNKFSNSKHSLDFTNKVVPYFKNHCIKCHGPDDEEGSLRVDKIIPNLDDEYTLSHLQNIIDEITVENMPPEEEPLPDSQDTIEIINILTNIEKEVKEKHTAGGGRPIRRLTRTEFSNTIKDLLGIQPQNVDELPDDLYVGNFETNAETLYLTDLHVDLYLNKSRQVIRKFIASRHDKPGKVLAETNYSPLLKRSIFGFSRQDVPNTGSLIVRTHWWVRNPAEAGQIEIGPTNSNQSHTITGTIEKPQIIDFEVTSSGDDISWAIKKSPTKSVNQLAGLSKKAAQKKTAQLNSVRITDGNLISVQEGKFQHPVVLGKIEHIKQSATQPHDFFSTFLKNSDDLPDSAAPAILKKFAILAKRGRAADPSYISMLNKVFKEGRDQGMPFWQAIEEPMAISLCSIDSILHFEDRNPSKKSRAISGLELANRLSYMLWRSAPDPELVQLGMTKSLIVLCQTLATNGLSFLDN